MILNERNCRKEHILSIAKQMMTAARTAPKGKGVDNIEIAMVEGDSIISLAEATRRESERTGLKFLLRDADNIEKADVVILIGSRTAPLGLNCGYCGYETCAQKELNYSAPCAINMVDLGIAIGSMVSTAADLRVDTRVMFSIGLAARTEGILENCHSIYAVPVSASTKNPFFDR